MTTLLRGAGATRPLFVMTICSVKDCDNKAIARNLCDKHYRRYRKYGDPLMLVRHPRRRCSVKGCTELTTAYGFCPTHYQRYRKWADPTYLTHRRTPSPYPKGKKPATCTASGCDQPTHALGLCRNHWRRQREYGSGPTGYQDCPVCRKQRYRTSTGHEMCADCWKLAIRRTVIRICQPNGFWSKQSCLNAGREWINLTGYFPSYADWTNLDHLLFPGRSTIEDRFGSWRNYIDELAAYWARS